VVWEVLTDQRVICLTFDDGPDAKYTQDILDLLKENQAKATFFVTGKQVKKIQTWPNNKFRMGMS